jgi:hypothetical protein
MPEAAHREAPPARACHECGARQDECQMICVECGAAVPRARSGRLRALKPLSLAGFAVLVVTSAAYGVTANAGRDESAVKQAVAAAPPGAVPAASATPAPAPTPAPPADARADTAPADPAPETPADPAPAPAAPAAPPATPAPGAPASPAPSGGSGGTSANGGNEGGGGSGAGGGTRGGSGGGGNDGSAPARSDRDPRRPAWLSEGDQPYSAALYDPYGSGEDEHASQAPRAVDGRAATAWTSAEHPGGLNKPGVGLVVEASGFQSYSAIGIQTKTPGLDVQIFSTDASEPPQGGPDQPGWKLEATRTNIKEQQRVALRGATAHYLIVWITKLARGKPRASLSEISLLP